ncbi:MAG: hypothetical protein FJZ01_15200 [Candidatus Sericytochromatia bacterium]|nr:hypothetical protein [Candidatus Tanganyikabacteria bacterium]
MLRHVTWQSAPALELANAAVRTVVVPEHGGKLASLEHVPSGRDWLWHNPHLAPRAPAYDGDFVGAHDVGGWDECFPAVRADFYPARPWRGCRIPDHGELWCTPWEITDHGDEHVTLAASGTRFPYRFLRTMRLLPEGLLVSYEAENRSAEAFPFLWCAHPLLAAAPGMALRLPPALGSFRIYSGGPFLYEFDPPRVLPDPGSFAIKCFAPVYGGGTVALVDGDSEFRISYQGADVTHLNLWLNCGAWSGVPGAPPYYNIGIEPGIGPGDDLDLALTHLGEAGVLEPRGKRQWSLEVTLR